MEGPEAKRRWDLDGPLVTGPLPAAPGGGVALSEEVQAHLDTQPQRIPGQLSTQLPFRCDGRAAVYLVGYGLCVFCEAGTGRQRVAAPTALRKALRGHDGGWKKGFKVMTDKGEKDLVDYLHQVLRVWL